MSIGRIVAYGIALGVMLASQAAGAANLIRNGSFEATPCATPCNQDQAYLPSEWLSLNSTPDTYSNDGSYGLTPDGYGNFTGAAAQDGIRWVAGWSAIPEILGQVLSVPLVPGTSYTLTAYLREAVRPDLANPGTYEIELWDSTDYASSNKIVLGALQPLATTQTAWTPATMTFVAPAQASSFRVLALRPIKVSMDTYPALDNLSLVAAAGGGGSCGGTTTTTSTVSTRSATSAISAAGATVVIAGCDTEVPDSTTANGCVSTLVQACGTGAKNHGGYVSCIAHLTNQLVSSSIITGAQKGSIQSCAARSNIP